MPRVLMPKQTQPQPARPKKQSNADEYAHVRSSCKRTDYLSWDTYFMGVAFLTGMRSKDPSTQVGACIVNQNNRIVGVGYNGFPAGIKDEELPWEKESAEGMLFTKYPYVCHAELNAVLNKNVESCNGCRLYSTLYPCCECAKVIIQSGIRHVIYASDKNKDKDVFKASKLLFQLAGIKTEFWSPSTPAIHIPLYYDDELPPQEATADGDDQSSGDSTVELRQVQRGETASSSSSTAPVTPPRKASAQLLREEEVAAFDLGARHLVVAVITTLEDQRLIEAALGLDYALRFAASAGECSDLLRQGLRPSVLLLDTASVGKKGAELCRSIRSELGLSSASLSIVALCPQKRLNEVGCKYLEAGCDDYVSTPLVAPLLFARVRSALQGKAVPAMQDNVVPPLPAAFSERRSELTRLAEEVAQIQRQGVELAEVTFLALDLAAMCGVRPSEAKLKDTLLLNSVLEVFDEAALKHGVVRSAAQTDPYIYVARHEQAGRGAAAAVSCGLAFVQAWRGFQLPGNVSGAKVRLGIHTGIVASGEQGLEAGDKLFDEATNVAKELQAGGVAECLHISNETRRDLGKDFVRSCGAVIVQRPVPKQGGALTHLVVPFDLWGELQELLSARADIATARASTPQKHAKKQGTDGHLDEYIKESSRMCYPGSHLSV